MVTLERIDQGSALVRRDDFGLAASPAEEVAIAQHIRGASASCSGPRGCCRGRAARRCRRFTASVATTARGDGHARTGAGDQTFRPRHEGAPPDRGHQRCHRGHHGVGQTR
jgi:hypothetical protein